VLLRRQSGVVTGVLLDGWLDRVAFGVYGTGETGRPDRLSVFRFADSWPPLQRPEVCEPFGPVLLVAPGSGEVVCLVVAGFRGGRE
jgi:hypothetical protein